MQIMKKIVIDARELRQSTGRYVERLLYHLQDVDKDPNRRYYVLLKPKDMDGWNPKSKRFIKVACRYKEFTFGEQLGMAWQIYRLKPDLVHFSIVQQPVLYLRKKVTTMHDLTTVRFRNPAKNRFVFWFKQRVYVWVNRVVARTSHTLITPTEFVKQDIAKFTHTNSRKIVVTYEAGDTYDMPAKAMPELEGKQFIMYLGRPTPHKNLERLIDAYALLQPKHPDLLLVLVGKKDANYKRHEKRVRKLGLENIIFTDFTPDNNVRWLYEHCQAYIFPSLSEGFGLPALEAMGMGAPVVSSNATCLPEIYGDAAEYFDPLDVEDMAAKIHKVISNDKRRQELSKLGKKQAAKYSWRRMAEQTLAIYKDALGEK